MRGGPAQGHPGVRAKRAGPQLPSSLALPQSPRGQFEGALETRRCGSLEGSTGGLGPSPSCTMDMLCDLGQVVTLSSPVSVQGRGPVILARVPPSLPHPSAMDGPESAQPGPEPIRESHTSRGPIPFPGVQRGAGWERSARRPAGVAAALCAAPRASSQGQCGRGGRRRGSGWLNPAAPTLLLR